MIGMRADRPRREAGRSWLPRTVLVALVAATTLAVTRGTTGAAAPQDQTYELGDDDAWVPRNPPPPGSPEAMLLAARRTLAAGEAQRAEFLATEWIDQHPSHELLPEAYLLRGDALSASGEHYRALFDYELIARTFYASSVFVTALEREFEIAKMYASGVKRKIFGLKIASAKEEAEELLLRIQERLPGSRLDELAGITLADHYFDERELELAADMYAVFLQRHPKSEFADKAKRRLIYVNMASFKGPEFDAAGIYEARTQLRAMKADDPVTAQRVGADALLTRIDASDARKLLTTAEWYVRTADPVAAELTIRRLVRRYPRTPAAADAMRLIPSILEDLPARLRAEAPDYDAYRAAILGLPAVLNATVPAAAPTPAPKPLGETKAPGNGGAR